MRHFRCDLSTVHCQFGFPSRLYDAYCIYFVASVYSTSTGTQHDRAGKEDRPQGPTEQNVHPDLLPHCPEEKENDSSVGSIYEHHRKPPQTSGIHTFLCTIRNCLLRFISSSYSWCS